MLRNVAIPLMLAASEAEAAVKTVAPTAAQVERALNEDRAKKFDGLIADADACSVGTTQAGTPGTVAALSALLGTAKSNLTTAEAAVTALTKVGGAWTVADDARKKAVADAVAKEITASSNTVPGLIDLLDTADEEERAAAKKYWDAYAALEAGKAAATAALNALNTANAKAGTLLAAKNNAYTAVQAVGTQLTNERKWRSWLYCELGAAAGIANEQTLVFDKVGTVSGTKNWYNALPGQAATGSLPASCEVPAVTFTAGQSRAKVTYYFTLAGLAAADEPKQYDGVKRWSATLAAAQALAGTTATVDRGDGYVQTAAGRLQYWTGLNKQRLWKKEAMDQELAFFKYVEDARAVVATEVGGTKWMSAGGQLTSAITAGAYSAKGVIIGSTVNSAKTTVTCAQTNDGTKDQCNGPTKRMADILTRIQAVATTGFDQTIGATATDGASAGTEYIWTWATNTASIGKFKTANGLGGATQSAAFKWQAKAAVLTAKLEDWWKYAWATKLDASQTGTESGVKETEIKDGVNSKACDTSTTSADWSADINTYKKLDGNSVTIDTEAKCKSYCIAWTRYNIMDRTKAVDATIGDSIATTTGSDGSPRLTAAADWCGAYSWEGASCKTMKKKNTPVKSANAGKCFVMDASSGGSDADGAKAQAALQDAVRAAWDDGVKPASSSAASVLQAAISMTAQAALQTAWMEAWYDGQYWTSVGTNIAVAQTPKPWADIYTVRSATTNTVNTNPTGAGALQTASAGSSGSATGIVGTAATLATLNATKATADAAVASLQARIGNSTTEVEALLALANGLSTANAASTSSPGVLDTRFGTALKAWQDYTKTSAPKGGQQLATEAKTAADAKVKASAGTFGVTTAGPTKYVAGGALVNTVDSTLDAWTKSKTKAGTAKKNLTAVITDAALQKLRDDVNTKQGLWATQNQKLVAAQADVVAKKALVKTAEVNLAAGTVTCQVAQYDKYRDTLEKAMIQRGKDLATIKGLITTELTRIVTGDAGSRCEKALSNGNWRPERNEETVCVTGLCCGAARIWMESGTTKDAAWRTIETCQPSGTGAYSYQPPRAPMATTLPPKVVAKFACIEGAQRLAVAASAMAAAAFMLA